VSEHAARQPISERQLQEYVLELARLQGWLAYHTFDSRRSQAGFPDLVLVRPPRLLFVELKGETSKGTLGKLSKAQREWLDALIMVSLDIQRKLPERPLRAVVWTPEDWHADVIARELR
jgi:VRR-NUC domain